MTTRRAKIVATVGPACVDENMLEMLIAAGADVIRLDFSNGTHEQHAVALDRVRAASRQLLRPVAVLQDLEGRKIRTGPLAAGRAGVALVAGAELVLTPLGTVLGAANLVSTSCPRLAEEVRPGDRLLIDDGIIELEVLATDGQGVRTEVVEGGQLFEHRDIHVAGVTRRGSISLSEKDRSDMVFGLAHGVDAVSLSCVSTAEDITRCREEMMRAGRVVPIFAKIERPEAIEKLDEIVDAADGIILARDDFGVEILPERVPSLQKDICEKARLSGKPVVVATQMLSSMTERPRPTRAEASDVANAIWDGADAVMLSFETALGRFPLQSLKAMDRIVSEAEQSSSRCPQGFSDPNVLRSPAPLPLATAAAACETAQRTGAVAICCFTSSGATAGLLSRFRPGVPIIAFSPEQSIRRRLALLWGVLPRMLEPMTSADLMVERVSDRLLEENLARPGDRVVLVFGSPLGTFGYTNSMRLHEVLHPNERGSFA